MDYLLHILILSAIYSILSVSLELLAGRAGILSIAQAAFFGVGAYASALVAVRLSGGFFVGVLAGVVFASLVSLVVSLPSLRLHNDYFVIATFGFQIIVFNVLNNWTSLTHGPMGISGIPQPVLFGLNVDTHSEFLVLASLFAAFVYLVIGRITRSPFGRVLHAIREDEVFARAHGKNPLYFKVAAFAVSGALTALAGSLCAHYVSYIDPTTFTLTESILIITMVVVGGAGSLWGPFIGAILLVSLPEALRFVGLPSAIAANVRQIIYGALLLIMMMFRPKGLVGRFGFGG
jgi:branched-chain amino acid transport system permease protein